MPAAILAVIPIEGARWGITMAAAALGAIFLLVNFLGAIKKARERRQNFLRED